MLIYILMYVPYNSPYNYLVKLAVQGNVVYCSFGGERDENCIIGKPA
jgi:hypothetical protein